MNHEPNQFDHPSRSKQLRSDLDRLEAITRAVAVNHEDTLQLIVDQLCEKSPWTMASLVILEEDGRTVRVAAQYGLPDLWTHNAIFPAVGSAALAALQDGQSFICEDALSYTEFPVVVERAERGGWRSFLGVPLPLDSPRAVLSVFSPLPRHFSAEEVAHLEAIAHQASVAIRSAALYDREHQLLTELTTLAEQMRAQNEVLNRVLANHFALTRVILDGGGLDSIAQTLAELLGNPVMFENQFFQVLSSATASLPGSETPLSQMSLDFLGSVGKEDREVRRQLHDIAQSHSLTRLPAFEQIGVVHPRVVVPVVAGRDRFGYLSVIEALRVLEPVDLMTAERAAIAFALEMLKQKAAFEVELRVRADFLSDLLSGAPADKAMLMSRAPFLRFDFSRPSNLLVIYRDDVGERPDAIVANYESLTMLLHLVDDVVARHYSKRLVVPLGDRIIVFTSIQGIHESEHRSAALSLARSIQATVARRSPDFSISIAVGPRCSGLMTIQQAYADTMRTIRALSNLGRHNQIIEYDELGIYGLLLGSDECGELHGYPRRRLAPLLDYDRRHRGELTWTLQAYLWQGCNAQATARELSIHPNTLYHRLRRIQELMSIDLSNAEERLELQLALKIHSLSERDLTTNLRSQ